MNLTIAQARSTVEAFLHEVTGAAAEVLVCPPYISLSRVHEALKGSEVQLGAQDVFWKDSGAFTGRVSAPMLSDVGVTTCLVGHSETRGKFGKLEVDPSTVPYFAESDETINLKIKALLYHAIRPMLCVGETLAEREAGTTDAVIHAQVTSGLTGIDASEMTDLVVAYEPVWAIGTGKTCDSAEAERVCEFVRETLRELVGDQADKLRVLYGGSVKAANAKELFSQPNIDGGLVGGASLIPEEFIEIVRAAG
jgi:triosephosphate isomerase